ncbi:prolyl oligopeptidase family serine peptidase, partial [Burkholderia multivorans]
MQRFGVRAADDQRRGAEHLVAQRAVCHERVGRRGEQCGARLMTAAFGALRERFDRFVVAQSPFENWSQMWFKCGMWKKEHQDRQAKLAKKTKRYPSDMTDI